MNIFLGEEGSIMGTAISAYKFLISERKVLQTAAYFRSATKYSNRRYIICKLVDGLCSGKEISTGETMEIA
jgi:hypothetical protein